MTPARMGSSGWALYGERLAVTVGLAAVSYVVVESPIRRRVAPDWRAVVAAPAMAGLALATVAVSTVLVAGQAAPTAAAPVHVAAVSTSGKPPVKVLLVGDSLAGSLGVGLGEVAPQYGVDLVNEGAPGCSVSMDQQIKVLDYTVTPGPPCAAGDPNALLAQWRRWVDTFNPDVVVYAARGELFNQEVDGRWENVGQPAFDRYLATRLAQAVAVLGSRGATVELLTAPVSDSGQANGTAWPEDTPARVVADDEVIRQVAAADGAEVFDLGSMVTPGNRYEQDVDGVGLRCQDGVHFTAAGGEWVAPKLLPEVARLGRDHQMASPGGTWPGTPPPVVPPWWQKLPCG